MSRAPLVRALIALGIVAGSLYVAVTTPARLGLDLRGGTQIVLETQDSPTVQAGKESTDRAVEVLRRRVDALGVAEPTLTRSGDRRIIVELPGLQDPREAAEVIGRTAQLTFHPVLGIATPTPSPSTSGSPSPSPAPTGADDELVLPDEDGQDIRLGGPALTGEGVDGAAAELDPQGLGGWFVTIDFKGSGEQSWKELTGTAACAPPNDPVRRVAIVLDDQVISSPQVDPSVPCDVGIPGGSTQITGDFTQEEAKELAVLIRGGALPVPVEVIEQRTVGATLGAAAIDASAKAAVIGVALTALFIIVVYRLLGALATVAFASYALLSYAALVGLGATLTLPGLAGFVLAIGMAIDANVLVFERAREEYAASPDEGSATRRLHRLRQGVERDHRLQHHHAAGCRAAVLLRVRPGEGLRRDAGHRCARLDGVGSRHHPGAGRLGGRSQGRQQPSVGHRHRRRGQGTDLADGARPRPDAARAALVGWLVRRPAAGGDRHRGPRPRPRRGVHRRSAGGVLDVGGADGGRGPRGRVRRRLPPRRGPGERTGTTSRSAPESMTNDEEADIRAALAAAAGGDVSKERDELIGPSLGDELRQKALIALGVALLAQLAYLAIRFRWTLGAAAVAAMAHDVLVLVGVFAWLGKPIDGVFLAALLTVIGYSVNDSVVVFDRVREVWGAQRRWGFPKVVNSAIVQTVPRTVNTGLGAMFILGALAFLGGDSLTDFAIALLIGIGVGTYSSMFTAGPLAIELERMSPSPPPPLKQASGARPRVDRDSSGAVV